MSYSAVGFGVDFTCAENMIKAPSGALGCVCKPGFTCTNTLANGICVGFCLATAQQTEFPSLAAKVCVEAGLIWDEASQTCLDPRVPRTPPSSTTEPPTRVPLPSPGPAPAPSPMPTPSPSTPPLMAAGSTSNLAIGAGVALGLFGLALVFAPKARFA